MWMVVGMAVVLEARRLAAARKNPAPEYVLVGVDPALRILSKVGLGAESFSGEDASRDNGPDW